MLSRHALCLFGFTTIVLTGCSQSSKAIESLQTQILEDVMRQGGSSLKAVVCPTEPQKEPSFTCTGILDSGNGFDIPVKSQEDKSYAWEIVSIKGLLNMKQLIASIQSGLTAEIAEAKIDCGNATTYKVAKPGEQFECKVEGNKLPEAAKKGDDKSSKPTDAKTDDAKPDNAALDKSALDKSTKAPNGKPEKITGKVMVTIAASGDISWQRILPEDKDKSGATEGKADTAAKASGTKPDGAAAKSTANSATPDGKADSKTPPTDSTSAPPSAAKSGEEAVSAGAFDAAED